MTATKRRIGFVDDNLENFHANTYLKLLRNELEDRGFVVAGCNGMKVKQSREWAEKNAVPYFSDMDALNEAVEFFIVLAPSAPEVHMALCQKVFPYGKATYVDKTFAPDLATAKRIFALADRYRVPMQTTSVLRYTNVQDEVQEIGAKQVKHMVTWGGGSSFDEYAIHPVELAVSCMGPGVKRLMRRGTGHFAQLLLAFTGNRTAVVNVYTNARTPYAASVTTAEGTQYIAVDSSKMFLDTAASALELFENGKPSIDRKESLMIRRILDVAGQKRTLKGFVTL